MEPSYMDHSVLQDKKIELLKNIAIIYPACF